MKLVLSALALGAGLLGLGVIRRKSLAAGNVRQKNYSRVTGLPALCLTVATVAATLLPFPVVAQEKAVRYVGELASGRSSCLFNNREIQVDIKGDEVRGYWLADSGGRNNFRGKMTGSSLGTIIIKSNRGEPREISGEIKDGNLAIRVQVGSCRYNAVLKKV